eukprot:9587989-Ditylum_brightwellii.AAC.1
MGSVSAPDIAGQEMTAVVIELRKHPLFQGTTTINLVMALYTGNIFGPHLHKGQLKLNQHCQQALIIWIYCNSFLVHGASEAACQEA